MTNVDKDFDGMISPDEFYELLSQKFSAEDDDSEKKNVFNRMDKNKDEKLDVDELHEVSQMLGESLSKADIKDMVSMFHKLYDDKLQPKAAAPGQPQGRASVIDPNTINFELFKLIMDE